MKENRKSSRLCKQGKSRRKKPIKFTFDLKGGKGNKLTSIFIHKLVEVEKETS